FDRGKATLAAGHQRRWERLASGHVFRRIGEPLPLPGRWSSSPASNRSHCKSSMSLGKRNGREDSPTTGPPSSGDVVRKSWLAPRRLLFHLEIKIMIERIILDVEQRDSFDREIEAVLAVRKVVRD